MDQHRKKYSETELVQLMHERGIRPSVQRLAVLSGVANTTAHPTADEIFTALSPYYPSLSRTTVYNSLRVLVEAGLVRELDVESNIRHYDLAQKPHGHFMCRVCGSILDMPIPEGIEEVKPKGFEFDCVEVTYHGICPECIKKRM